MRSTGLLSLALLTLFACSKNVEGEASPFGPDGDGDGVPDGAEDRNRNGRLDPGETDPNVGDSDGDGIRDGEEVMYVACSPVMDRPFRVYDAPGAGSMILTDERVRASALLRTMDNKAPAFALADDELQVAASVVSKRPSRGVRTPGSQREEERRGSIASLGRVTDQRTRPLTTIEGFDAELAIFEVTAASAIDARTAAGKVARAMLQDVPLTGLLPAAGMAGTKLRVQLLTIMRSPSQVVLLTAIVVGEPTEPQQIRLDELTDGTNLARHGSFTRHVCDELEAKAEAKADIIFVVDDSGSMEDDQMALRDAANAMEQVLGAARIDFRLGVAATRASDQTSLRRGVLELPGLTADIGVFKRAIVVGARGGWEPGLETGIRAVDRLLPRTSPTEAPKPDKLREGAATILIHLSDERDQTVECAACGRCDAAEGEQRFCSSPDGQRVIDDFIQEHRSRGIVSFALVGDLPNGCQQPGNRDDFEPGQGYVEVANATGGQFGSLCGNMQVNLRDVARVASGVASTYRLSVRPASASLRVAIGPPGRGRAIPRSRTDGFDYDAVQNSIVFYGAARPADGDEVVVGYRRWDWANNPGTPADPCDMCEMGSSCLPTLDTSECAPICGDVICEPGLVCFESIAECGDPMNMPPPPNTACGECGPGLICDPTAGECVPPCESTGCAADELCNTVTHLCEVPSL